MFPLHDNIRSRRFPFVNYAIILVNILVFAKELSFAERAALDQFIFSHALVPARFMADPIAHLPELFTAMFMHGGWGHIIGNMWFLHIFGDNMEDNLGHARYLLYYLVTGIGAAVAQLMASPSSALPMLGASGAIAGVLGGYIVLYPGARVLTFFVFVMFVRFVEVPAFFFLGLWFLVQMANGLGSLSQEAVRGEVGGVAWWAHAGGFAAGFLSILFFRRR